MPAALSEQTLARMQVQASKAKLARVEARNHYKHHGTVAERNAVDWAERGYGWEEVAFYAKVPAKTAKLIVLGIVTP